MAQKDASITPDESGSAHLTTQSQQGEALQTNNSGGTEPSYKKAGMYWLDTSGTPWILKMYDGTDWIIQGYFNATTNLYTPVCDEISEATSDAGVTVDSVLLKDGEVTGDINSDTINEETPDAGVTVDSVLLKDGEVTGDINSDTINEETPDAGVTIDSFKIKDNAPDPTSWPSFAAYLSGDQGISSTDPTKIAFDTEEFDTNADYDHVTNYRFTPTVAGKYLVTFIVEMTNVDSGVVGVLLYKNGTSYKRVISTKADSEREVTASCIVNMNGTTDYLEMFVDSATDSSYVIAGGDSTESAFEASRIA